MSTPKSVTKVYGNGHIEYTSNVDACQYYLFELSRAALRDVAKYITKVFKTDLKAKAPIKRLQKARVSRKIYSSKNTKYPRMIIGIGKPGGPRGWLTEFGTHDGTVPKMGLFYKAATEHVDKIIEIESQYLSGLSEEASRLAEMIDEKEVEEYED